MARIVLATIGSLGDLHPYMALARALQARGHDAVVAASEYYRERVVSAGLGFAPMRPDPPLEKRELYERILDPKTGTEFTFRHLILGSVADTYCDLKAAVVDVRADLMITSPTVFPARLLAEKYGTVWISSVLAPLSMFSAYEPPVVAGVPAALTRGPASLRPWWGRLVLAVAQANARDWPRPLHELRATLQLPPRKRDPIFVDQHAPGLTLALFSAAFARQQPDWPAQTLQPGFVFYDAGEDASAQAEPQIEAFLQASEAPIIFTLGSTAVNDAKTFFAVSAAAALRLGKRALLIAGGAKENRIGLPDPLPDHIAICSYAPYSAVFPRAAAVVHQGGIGTTAQVLRAGVPQIIVPFSFDQPDNAARVEDLGIGRSITQRLYTEKHAASVLHGILTDASMRVRASAIAESIAAEHGVDVACDMIEKTLTAG